MGQVFTWEDVARGRVPYPEDIQEVVHLVRRRLADEPGVKFATLFGSVVRGDFDIRSDIDCLMVFENAHEAQVRKVTNALSTFARELYVPINFTPCDVAMAQTRFHHLGTAFIRHVSGTMRVGGLIKGESFLEVLAPTVPVDQEIESYLKMKLYTMMECLASDSVFSEEQQVRFFKKGLEAVTHTARKVLLYEDLLVGDSKQEVRMRYREVMPQNLSDMLDALIMLDHLYTEELYDQLDDGLNEAKYRAVLSLLSLGMPSIAEFIRLNILHISAQTRQ